MKPPEPLVFFLDRSIGRKKVAAALRQIGVQVKVHDDNFISDAKDEEWLREVGRKGWIVLTKDTRIRYRASQLAALMKGNVAAFVLTAGNLSGDEMAAVFVKSVPAISKFVARHPTPFIAKIARSGAVSILFPLIQK